MKRQYWIIPVLIVAANALAIIVKWGSLPELLPAHFDLDGNASGTMPRSILTLYPLIGAAILFSAFMIARKKGKLNSGLIILSSGISLILLLSTMVTLTSGKMPLFMLAEPVILLATVIGFVICLIKSLKKRS